MADEVIDLRDYGPGFVKNPYPVYERLRERGPVHPAVLRDGSDAWLVVGHEAARAALAHPALLKDWNAASREWKSQELGDPDATVSAFGRHMLTVDPPDHTRLRRLVSNAFTPRRIEALRPRVQEITDGLLDALPDGGRADLIDAFAFPLPMAVICEVLGVPFLDGERFRTWSNRIVAPEDDDPEGNLQAAEHLAAYLGQLIEDKRGRPGDDVLSALIETTDEGGDRLSPDELQAMAFLLLVAGHETTVNLIGNGILALLRHPDQLAALRAEPALLDGAVEEMLRYEGPLTSATVRFTKEPVDVGGTVIPGGGQPVIIMVASAHRDPGRYPDPDRFDIRRPVDQHLAFGHGIHFCLGAPLARLEGRIAVRSLLERCPGLALDTDPAGLSWRPGHLIRGVQRLPIRY